MEARILGDIPFAKNRCDLNYREKIRELYETIISEFPDSHILVFTSKDQDAGKSTITEELAYMFAKNGNRVLAMDGDPFNPTLFGHLPGITEYSNGIETIDEILSYIGRVDFLCSGARPVGAIRQPPDDKIEALIQNASEQYDYVLIDTPPLNMFHDACVYAKFSDGVILIQPTNNIPVPRNGMADVLLDEMPVIGMVLNHPKRKMKPAQKKKK